MNFPWYNFYDRNVPFLIHSKNLTLFQALERNVKQNPKKDIYICLGKKINAEDFLDLVNNLANSLLNLQVKKGDRVAILIPNLIQFPALFYASIKIGAILVPLNPLLTSPEISKLLRLSNPVVFIFLNLFQDKINKLEGNFNNTVFVKTKITDIATPALKIVFPLTTIFKKQINNSRKEKLISFKNFLLLNEKKETEINADIENVAVLLSTGGTTGTPKLAALTNASLYSNAEQIAAWVPHLNNTDTLLAALPLFHSFGLTIGLNVSLLKEFTVILVPKFKTKAVIKLIKKYKVNLMPGVPIMFAAINKFLSQTNSTIPYLKECFSGGTELIPEIQNEFEKLTNAKISEAYGLTEASPAASSNPIKGVNKQGSIGIPLPSTEIKILHTENYSEMKTGEIGEIAIKGPQLMKGYWQNEKETQKVFRDGWLLTGDLGKMDEDGFVFITGRKKEMITNCGFKIYPQEVEKVLIQHTAVNEAGVCAIPDGFRGEAIKAVVVLNQNNSVSGKELIEHCKNKLAPFKVPKQIVFADELPKSFLGKVVRRLLNEEA